MLLRAQYIKKEPDRALSLSEDGLEKRGAKVDRIYSAEQLIPASVLARPGAQNVRVSARNKAEETRLFYLALKVMFEKNKRDGSKKQCGIWSKLVNYQSVWHKLAYSLNCFPGNLVA